MRDAEYCFWHSPAHKEEAAEARRLGGQRRRRERVVNAVYELEGMTNVGSVQRLIEIAVQDTLGLENSVARNRVLGTLAQAALRVFEATEFESRLTALESVHERRGKGKR
ncbi:hypothetical protein AYO38_05635 [bacterium SCGC AG-212-C10]|nr:hypothetical protein AYO38_05635 [bacterium SCGC AG-212-C10]